NLRRDLIRGSPTHTRNRHPCGDGCPPRPSNVDDAAPGNTASAFRLNGRTRHITSRRALFGQRAVRDQAERSIPSFRCVSGAWVLKGTRMPVSAIFENIEAGANIDDIMEWFDGLDREEVKAVIEFAARSLDKPPEYTR